MSLIRVPSQTYREHGTQLHQFFLTFGESNNRKYLRRIQDLRDGNTDVFELALEDLLTCGNDELMSCIVDNALRYITIIISVIRVLLQDPVTRRNDTLKQGSDEAVSDAKVQWTDHNVHWESHNAQYSVRLMPPPGFQCRSLRTLQSSDIGCLVKVQAVVTRTSDVLPIVEVIKYVCETCGCQVFCDVSKRHDFSPLKTCSSHVAPSSPNIKKFDCKSFPTKYPLVVSLLLCWLNVAMIGPEDAIQAISGAGILGSVLVFDGAPTPAHRSGDVVTIVAVFLPRTSTQVELVLNSGLVSGTYLNVMSIARDKQNCNDCQDVLQLNRHIDCTINACNAYSLLAQSIAPEIYGHEDVKKALLLQLIGGVTRGLPDGIKLRGDIHLLLMGDPGLAKSQLLKYVSSTSPRGVYTTGKGSSGVGLTASVVRDTITMETSLESGALVLADRGACCIDEFDKMDEYDRTAIHEVMEQQTVSIAKAGITTTLNARCSVLAAANPTFGRYSTSHSLAQNVNLPHSLISRFDLIFLLLDRPDFAADASLARHVTHVHRFLRNPDNNMDYFDSKLLRHYISQARHFEPCVPSGLTAPLVDAYVEQRQDTRLEQNAMTARQLLSILRLSQALARLRFDDSVNQDDIDEARRLTHMSQASIKRDVSDRLHDPKSKAFHVLREYSDLHGTNVLNYNAVHGIMAKHGIRSDVFLGMLKDYEELAIIFVDPDNMPGEKCIHLQ